MMEGPGADSEEKHEPVSDIDTAVVVVGLKALDPEWPIREAIGAQRTWLDLQPVEPVANDPLQTPPVHRSRSESVVPEATTFGRDRCTDMPEPLLDHVIGECEQCGWHFDVERPRRLQVDNELKFGRLHDRQVGRLGALEDAAGINAYLTKRVCEAVS